MNRMKKLACAAAATALLAACGTINTQVKEQIEEKGQSTQSLDMPMQSAPMTRVREMRGTMIPVVQVVAPHKGEWLKQFKVQLDIRNATPLSAVVSKLAEQGVNVVSDLPLDTYTYSGKVNATDGESALRAILGSVGLDYQIDDERRLVAIKPMVSRSWFLNIGNRKSSFASDGVTSGSGSGDSGNASSNGSSSSQGSQSAQGGFASGQSSGSGLSSGGSGSSQGSQSGNANGNGSGSSNNSTASNGTGVVSADDFWSSLSSELNNRLSVLVPRSMASGRSVSATLPGPLPGALGLAPAAPFPPTLPGLAPALGSANASGAASGELYVKTKVGGFSLNPETGAITVQAPHWVLEDLDGYFKRVQEMYNTDISFIGELVLLTSNRSDSEGVDISAFTRWVSKKYTTGIAIANNALGGVTLSIPPGSGAPSFQLGSPVSGPVMGVTYTGVNNAMDIFNAYLSEMGKVSVIQRPLVTTTSGVPGVFSKKFTDYYNTVSQQAASGGTGSAATATQNVLVPVELGTELRINPRIDIATGLIRAQLSLNQVIKSGSKTIPQTITFGNTATTINTTIPLLTKQNISGEILLRDNDLVIVGGQTENSLSSDENGLPGQDGPLGGVLGNKKASRGTQTYYFALRVAVSKRQ